VQYVWGGRYIDDIVLRREDRDMDGDYVPASGDIDRWYLTDVQFSVVGILDETAQIVERVNYDPYGNARHHRLGDLDGDGDTDTADRDILQANLGNFGAGDLDRSGTVSTTDRSILNADFGSAIASGLISYASEDNQIGYDGYVFDRETMGSTVRHRHYDPVLGRWLERDPAGYVDGMNLYEYSMASPATRLDGFGNKSIRVGFRGLGGPYTTGNLETTDIQKDLLAMAKKVFDHNEKGPAAVWLLEQIDVNGDMKITKEEKDDVDLRIWGYSQGGVAAIDFSKKLNSWEDGAKYAGYDICGEVDVEVLVTLAAR